MNLQNSVILFPITRLIVIMSPRLPVTGVPHWPLPILFKTIIIDKSIPKNNDSISNFLNLLKFQTSDLTDDSSTVEETKLFEEEEEQVEKPALKKNIALEDEEEEQPEEENEEAEDKPDGGQQEKQGMADANGRPSLGGAVEEGEEAKENEEPGEEEQQKKQQHTMDDDEGNGGSLGGNASANDEANDDVDDGNADDDGGDDGCSVCPETEGMDEAAEITTGGKGGRGKKTSAGQNMVWLLNNLGESDLELYCFWESKSDTTSYENRYPLPLFNKNCIQ
jgi:hypothetical protein